MSTLQRTTKHCFLRTSWWLQIYEEDKHHLWMHALQRMQEEMMFKRSRGIWLANLEEELLRAHHCRLRHMDTFNMLDTNLFLDNFNIPANFSKLDKFNVLDNHNQRLRMFL